MNELRQNVGQMIISGFEGTTLEPPIAQSLARGEIGGVVLFGRNLGAPEEIADLCQSVHDAAPYIPFVAIDQEGGAVQRIKSPLTVWPSMRRAAQTEDAYFVSKLAEALCDEIAWLGFNLNFAPVLDIHTNAKNPIIGDRAFGSTPAAVSRYAGAFVGGMAIAGMMPCGKHFPGHGDTDTDSHLALPVLETDLATMTERELAPFGALIKSKLPMIMTAHILLPGADPDHPATLSASILSRLLRIRFGFDGIVITDDLNMRAIADRYDMAEIAERGLQAGIDIFLICQHEHRRLALFEALVRLGESSSMHRERIAQAAERVRAGREAWLRPYQRPTPLLDRNALKAHRSLLDKYALGT